MLSLMLFFFFNDTATTEIYTLSLHDALPISLRVSGTERLEYAFFGADLAFSSGKAGVQGVLSASWQFRGLGSAGVRGAWLDRKSTRLNSSHANISYAVFCLKKKKTKHYEIKS